MEYTENIVELLQQLKFKKTLSHKDEMIEYDVYKNGYVEATVDFTNKELIFHLEIDKEIKVTSPAHLASLINVINV